MEHAVELHVAVRVVAVVAHLAVDAGPIVGLVAEHGGRPAVEALVPILRRVRAIHVAKFMAGPPSLIMYTSALFRPNSFDPFNTSRASISASAVGVAVAQHWSRIASTRASKSRRSTAPSG